MNQSHAVCLRAKGIHDIDRQQKRNFLVDINERVIQHYSCTGYLIDYFVKLYRKIPKISPGAYIFQRPFFKRLIFGGAYLRRGICVSK